MTDAERRILHESQSQAWEAYEAARKAVRYAIQDREKKLEAWMAICAVAEKLEKAENTDAE
jgi:hypothetical protein